MADEEDFTSLPLPDQFTHKNWKARKGGYESAARAFTTAHPHDPIVRDFLLDSSLWKGAVSDANVAAQQEGLQAYNAFLHASGPDGARKTRTQTVQGVVEKGLTGRPAAKGAALESLLLLIELDKPEPVIEELLPFLAHKQPKIIAATLSALTSIYHAYGCKTVEPKPVIKLLPKAFGHADKNVRADAQSLTVELYRWLREAMKPLFWAELKEVQQKDLDKLFEPVKAEPAPKQERLLKTQQAAQEEAAASSVPGAGGEDDATADGEEGDGGEIDLEPEYEVVDAFAKIPKDFGERLASSKWKDRKDALDELHAAVNFPALQEGPFDEVLKGCAKSMKDANIAVVAVAANCVECIALGLRRAFARYRATILAPMLERFKEKKASVTDALAAACDAVFAATSLAEIEADIIEALKNKNPQVKEHTAKFLVRSLKSTREAPSMEQTKEVAETAKRLLTESVATLRDAGAEILGVLWKIMGDRNMLNHLDGLDDIRKTKVKEYSDAAEVKAKWRPKSAAAPAPKAAGGSAGGAAKKPGLGANRRPAGGGGSSGVKRPAASAASVKPSSPSPTEDAALQPRPSSRPVSKGPGGLRPPGPGLKAPGTGLQKSGLSGLKAPSSGTNSGAASPRRSTVISEDHQTPQPKAGVVAPGRGLAGRPLSKPSASSVPPSSPPPNPRQQDQAGAGTSSALSSIERQELTDLRSEVDLLRNQAGDLRQDKLRLTSQIAELQNQNAQLIEDHTRDVLQIKAKETQLVRARSDAENAEERANSLSKEIDRLKREMSRLNRQYHGAGSPPVDAHTTMGGLNGDTTRPPYSTSRSHKVPSARAYEGLGGGGTGMSGAGGVGVEGKENNNPDLSLDGQKLSGGFSAPSRPMSNGSSEHGRATPLPSDGALGDTAAGGSTSGKGSATVPANLNRSQSEQGVESWRRAAEVTQNLKARIEMMKARQNLGRGQ